MRYGSAESRPRRIVKAGIAAAAAVAGDAIFASHAGAAITTNSVSGMQLQPTNVMLKVPHGTTCAVVQDELFMGLRTPPAVGKKTV